MMLFLVHSYGWGSSINVVRAADADEAWRVGGGIDGMSRLDTDVVALDPDGPAEVLWTYDNSPDSRPGRD